MSTVNHDHPRKNEGERHEDMPQQQQRRHVTANPDDIDEDMEQGTQSGVGSPRSAASAAPDVMRKEEDSDDTN